MPKNQNKICVVIPLFNKSAYIARAMNSVLNQSYQNFELIVVDDGSTDNSADIAGSIKDGRIRVIKKANAGVSSARNCGIQEATSDLVAFLDADDAYKPDFLKRIIRMSRQYPDAGGYAANYEILSKGKKIKTAVRGLRNELTIIDINNYFRMATHGSPIWSSAVAIRKRVFDETGAFPVAIKLGEDLDTWIRVLFMYPIILDSAVGATYFQDAEARACQTNPLPEKLVFFDTLDRLMKQYPVPKKTQDEIREFKNFFIQNYAIWQIKYAFSAEGRKAFLNMRTQIFWLNRSKWIALSFVPMRLLEKVVVRRDGKIRVLHVIHTLRLGGAESNVYNLARFHDLSKTEPHVAYASGGPFEEKLRGKGVRLFKYADNPTKVLSLVSIGIILKLASYIRKNRIQVVHTHNFNAHVWGSLAAKLAGAKIVEHVHDPRYEPASMFEAAGLPVTHQFKHAGFFGRLSDVILVLTRSNREFVLKNRLKKEENVRLLLNGVPLENYSNGVVHPTSGKKTVFTAMRLSSEKNAAFILSIAEKTQGEDVIFKIAGDGPQKQSIEEEIARRGLGSKIELLGFRPDVSGILKKSDIFILPTLRELHSLTMLEAMSHGVPVLVSKGAGCNDDFISEGTNGFLLDPHDAGKWAEKISYLLEHRDEAKRIGEAGRKLVESQCDIRQTVKKIEAIYQELIRKLDR